MGHRHTRFDNTIIFDHPLIQHKLTMMREVGTEHRRFRSLIAQIAGLMVFEATRSFRTETVEIETPLERMKAQRITAKITVIPIMRAGLGMAEGVLGLMPEARVGHLGLARDEATLEPKVYLEKLPTDLDAGPVLLVDPMLATGGSARYALSLLKEAGAKDLRMACLVAAPEGLARMAEAHPDVPIYAAAVDERLDENGFIRPGLGDAGDRMYGTE